MDLKKPANFYISIKNISEYENIWLLNIIAKLTNVASFSCTMKIVTFVTKLFYPTNLKVAFQTKNSLE
jgi:hypothetical protein